MITKKSIFFSLVLVTVMIFFVSDFASAQVIKPKARTTPSGGPTIDQAQQEDEMGPKARVAVTRFEDKSAKGSSEIVVLGSNLQNSIFRFSWRTFRVLKEKEEKQYGKYRTRRLFFETGNGLGESLNVFD